jgi:glycosyltransferase involved in cell wall biosynthesis
VTRDVTVAIPVRGDAAPLLRLLRALDEQAGGLRLAVIVSDDCSEPPIASSFAADDFPSLAIEIVRTGRDAGPGGARNLALERVQTSWVAFLDADMLPGEGWLQRLDVISQDERAPDGIEGPVHAGEHATAFTHTTDVQELGGHHGAGNVAFRVDSLRAIGGFDERFYDARRGVHFREDTELRFRFDAAGMRVEVEPSLVALHPPHPRSFLTPVRLAQRYYFDPLLAREHPDRFREFVRRRSVGPVSLRRARHLAALAYVLGAAAAIIGAVLESWLVVAGGVVMFVAGWLATSLASAWRRRVPLRDIVPLAVVSAVVPLAYLWNYCRGIIRFRHVPRL